MLEDSASAGDHHLGLRCGADGLFLARVALVERCETEYRPRSLADLERLLRCAYGGRITVGAIQDGLVRVAAALNRNRMWAAQSEAARLPLADLANPIAALRLEIEDLRLAAEPLRQALLRAGWDPDKHPRAGVPPNPGWFAPIAAGEAGTQVAQGEEDERAIEDLRDPAAPLRQAQWDAAIARLRQIDPQNPSLSYLTNPGSAPTPEALDRLNAAVETAAIKRVTDKVMPGGVPIGRPGRNSRIRLLPGGVRTAKNLFDYLSVGGEIEMRTPEATVAKLPGRAGFITFRPESTSGSPAVDVNVPGVRFRRIHFR